MHIAWYNVIKEAKIRNRYNQETTPDPGYHMEK